jgi:hypothetical protein
MTPDVSEVHAASTIRAMMMEAACTSERSVDIDFTIRQYIPEDSVLHTEISRIVKCLVESCRGLILRYSPDIRLEGLRKTTKSLS